MNILFCDIAGDAINFQSRSQKQPVYAVSNREYGKYKTREHWIQRITFAAESNAACGRCSARRDYTYGCGQTDRHIGTERHNNFARLATAKVIIFLIIYWHLFSCEHLGIYTQPPFKPMLQLRFDYDTTTIRLRRKIDMFIFCLRRIGSRRASDMS